MTDRPRVAIAHDYLTQRGGAERVVLALHRAFPDAAIHTTLYDPENTYPEFRDAQVVVSPLNRIGPLRREHRAALLMNAVDGYTQSEIADILGVPPGTVASWLSRAKAQLREALTDG
jgi:RNA polymerase sigma factor (sigma-70 family)